MSTDIELLKMEVQGLHKGVNDIGTKMDMLLALQVQLVRLQEQHDNTRDSLDRAFKHISSVRAEISEVDLKVATVGGKLTFWRGLVLGGAFIGTFLMGFAQWYVLQQIHSLEAVANRADNFNLRVTLIENKLWPDKYTLEETQNDSR